MLTLRNTNACYNAMILPNVLICGSHCQVQTVHVLCMCFCAAVSFSVEGGQASSRAPLHHTYPRALWKAWNGHLRPIIFCSCLMCAPWSDMATFCSWVTQRCRMPSPSLNLAHVPSGQMFTFFAHLILGLGYSLLMMLLFQVHVRYSLRTTVLSLPGRARHLKS